MNNSSESVSEKIGAIPLDLLLSRQGLQLCNEIINGTVASPTMWQTLNIRMTEAGEGSVVFKGKPLEGHYNPSAVVHGGWAAGVLDSALGCCVWTKVPVGLLYTTAEFKVNLVRPITPKSGELVAEGRVVHMGRKLATAEATLKTLDGKLLAHGTETCAIIEPETA